jgi:hypothetical protein
LSCGKSWYYDLFDVVVADNKESKYSMGRILPKNGSNFNVPRCNWIYTRYHVFLESVGATYATFDSFVDSWLIIFNSFYSMALLNLCYFYHFSLMHLR